MTLQKLKGDLPEGCRFCRQGAKMVLLITGLCKSNCYYCPLSHEKMGKDVVYANEGMVFGPVKDDQIHAREMIVQEARNMNALGTAITGGDPLQVPDRTISLIHLLKNEFGDKHHIHLYTAALFNPALLRDLEGAGLDEIRFHPSQNLWNNMPRSDYGGLIKHALDTEMSVGVEIPVIPGKGMFEKTVALLTYLDRTGLEFVNLNELEFSETNATALKKKRFRVKNDVSSAVSGSEEMAIDLLEKTDFDITLHYCSSSFKDRVQLRRRLMRRAKIVQRPFELLTEDGTFLKGVVECNKNLMKNKDFLVEDFEIPSHLIHIDLDKTRIEIAPWILEEIALEITHPCYIVEEYPTVDRLEVERRPLN
jgi:pyruvate formate-lyase activating enzyme-like uncharacterized protein